MTPLKPRFPSNTAERYPIILRTKSQLPPRPTPPPGRIIREPDLPLMWIVLLLVFCLFLTRWVYDALPMLFNTSAYIYLPSTGKVPITLRDCDGIPDERRSLVVSVQQRGRLTAVTAECVAYQRLP